MELGGEGGEGEGLELKGEVGEGQVQVLPESVVSSPSLATFKHSLKLLYALSNFIILYLGYN